VPVEDASAGTTRLPPRVNASVIAAGERLGVVEIATLDRRQFTVVRPRHAAASNLLP
jgi:uncharacterized protein